ncbi:hypothetical protein [Neobacillus sp. 114]|uniref:OmpL47-type beta-barrel domain-containing protein n=1 Tax=Neobacillus sp. 114 TaxID=3048535 RepID=UPI0024C21651|nr:hypothetical protein [Neobacillus sp. 114]
MFKRVFNIPTFLVVLMLMYQLAFPIGNTMASASTTSLLPPSNLAYQTITPDDGKLTWSSVVGATGYKIYEIKDGQLVLLGNTAASSYNLNNLAEGSYRYVVSTISSEEESGPSSPVSVDIIYPGMLAPSTLTSTIRNGNDIVLSWGASQYAEKYNVYQISKTGEKTLVTATTARSYTILNAPEGSYTYAVSSENDLYGESPTTDIVKVDLIHPVMTQPANLSFTISNGTDVTLKWQAVDYANSYKIYEVIDGRLNLKSTVTGTSVKYSNLPAGDYTYKVFSFSDRFGESKEGSQVALTVSSIVIAPPSNLNYKIQNINDAVISWATVPYATGYKVYQVVNGERILKNTVTGTSVTYTNLSSGSYEYEVYSYSDRYGESEVGTKVSFYIDTYKMAAPANLSYKIQNGNDIVLNWSAVENATSYNIYKITDGQKVLAKNVTGTSTTFTNQSAGDYVYEVRSNSSRFGESEEGTQVSLKLEPVIINAPDNVSYELRNGNDIFLSWGTVDYATGYNIYQIINGEKVLKRTVTGTTTTFVSMPEGDYSYEVYATSSRFGESKVAVKVSLAIVFPVLNPPANVIQTIKDPTSFTLSWDAADYATSYKVYQIVDGQKVLKNTVTGTSVSFSNMYPGQYDYEVYTYSSRFGESKVGSSITAILDGQTLPDPTNLTYTINNGNDIYLKWNAVQLATSYKIYQIVDGELNLKRTVTGTATTFTNVSEGNFIFVVKAYSTLLGESLNGAEVNGSVVFPVMGKPENETVTISNGNDMTLKWNPSTYATAYKVYQIINGEKVLQKTVTGTSTTLTNLPEGDYTFEIYSYSDRFGESPEGSKVNVTIVYPVMQAPQNPTVTIVNGNDISLRWNASTYATAYKVYQMINGEKVLVRTVTGTAFTFTNMPEGDYHYFVHSYSDRFGESPEGSEWAFNLTWPVVQAPVLTGTVFNANNITLSWAAVTWANEYRVYKISGDKKELIYKGTARNYNVNNLTEDTHSFEVTAFSTRFGESVPSNRLVQKIVYPEMETPKASLQLLSQTSARISWDFVTYANGYNIYEIIDGKPVLIAAKVNNLSYTIQNLTYANHLYYVTSYSNSFGESKPSETVLAKLIIDTTAPVTKDNAPTQWVNQNQTVSLEATDDETGVAKTFYSLNDGIITEGTSILVDKEGINKILYHSVDKVGNAEQVKTAFVKIDKTAPETDINEIPPYAQSFAVELTAKDNLSGVAKTYYSINGSEYFEGTSFIMDQEGISEISYYSVDAAGNKEEVETAKFNIDKTAPITSAKVPETWVNQDVSVTLTAIDENSGVTKTYYSINGSEYVEGTNVIVEREGINQISFYSVDAAGNKEKAKTAVVQIDKTKPVTSTDVPKNWVKDNVPVTLDATDANSGIARTYYSINGSEFQEGTTFVEESEGVNEISYYSVDTAGNREAINTKKVKIDKTAPVTTYAGPSNWVKDDTVVTLTAADEHSGVEKTYYSINGSDFVEGTTVVVTQEGTSQISYFSIDAAGNMEEVKSVEVKIDKTAPTIITGLEGEYEFGSTLTLNYLAKDNLSGITKEEVTLNGKSYQKGDKITLGQPGDYKLKIKVTDAAGWTTTVEKSFAVFIPVTLEVLPKVIKGNNGVFTVKATLPAKYQSSAFDVSSVTLNGVSAKADNNGLQKQAEKGQFKFEREDFDWNKGTVELELRSYLNNKILVVGKAIVEVK